MVDRKQARESREERLAALRQKLKTVDTGRSAGFWSPKEGLNTIRVLPEVKDMEFFFQQVGKHTFPDKRYVYCPKYTSAGELECPVCELVDDLYDAGDKASKDLAGKIKVKKSFWMNIIDREHTDLGPMIFTPGVTIFDSIRAMIEDPDFGDVTSIEDGLDLVIERKGKGLDTEYQVRAKRNSSPLSKDQDEIDTWIDKAKDLSYVELSEEPDEDSEITTGHALWLSTYARIETDFGLDDVDVEELAEESAEAEENTRSVKKPVTTKKPVNKVKEEVEGEIYEDEGEDTESNPVRQEVAQRRARRSLRRSR